MNLGDSIAALASPPGRSLRAAIRLSGPGVDEALATLLEHPPTARSAAPARLRLSPSLSLPILLLYFPAPASYTGETAAELLIPGNPFLVDRILALLTAQPGLRPAEPGEFSARAYLNGRLTVDQAEGVASIVAAETADQVNAARDLLTGRTGSTYRAWSDELTTLLALVEAGIDFTDQEDVQPIAPADLHRRLAAILTSIDHHLGAAAGRSTIDALPSVALLGPPNAGKSTLFNALLGRRRAVTSPTPGTTRDALAEPLDLSHDLPGASTAMLIDLAGLEPSGDATANAADTIEAQMQSRAHAIAARADLILLCDPTGRFDQRPLHSLPPGRPILRIRTKADLPSPADAAPDPRSPEPPVPDPLPVCALDGWNLPLLRRLIAQRTTSARAAGIAGLLPRHRLALLRLRHHLSAADELARADQPRLSAPELAAAALREGLDALGELVGRISPDEVLGRIFASFCVGK
ncbi:MAG: 50S ribosome-binding GTPase [Phycisphaerales bacterium]|nr:50S ribosome-binding GTPase [Phycisphaerales bacterium]